MRLAVNGLKSLARSIWIIRYKVLDRIAGRRSAVIALTVSRVP
jgi:hypothetical protein